VLIGQDAYQQALKQIFARMPIEDRKDALTWQHALLAQSSIGVLMIIWKESTYVTEVDLIAIGLERDYSPARPLNCHSLATSIAESAADLGRTQKRVSGIVTAAEAYGLVDRVRPEGFRHFDLRGTARLHELMLRVGRVLSEIAADVTAQAPTDAHA